MRQTNPGEKARSKVLGKYQVRHGHVYSILSVYTNSSQQDTVPLLPDIDTDTARQNTAGIFAQTGSNRAFLLDTAGAVRVRSRSLLSLLAW